MPKYLFEVFSFYSQLYLPYVARITAVDNMAFLAL